MCVLILVVAVRVLVDVIFMVVFDFRSVECPVGKFII